MSSSNKYTNDELIEYLMTSDFNEELNTDELKVLLLKFRELYRYMYSTKDNKIGDRDLLIKKLQSDINSLEKRSLDSDNKLSEIENIHRKLKSRKLTLSERLKGKLNL